VPDPGTIHDMQVMNQRFILFRRSGVFYCEDTTTGKQLSLRTKDEGEATTLLHAKNEAFRQPILNLQIARAYMAASDPMVSKRTWQSPMDEMTRTKTGPTRIRHERAMLDSAFDTIRNRPVVETNSGPRSHYEPFQPHPMSAVKFLDQIAERSRRVQPP